MTINSNTSTNESLRHTRIIDTLITRGEKIALRWLAERMPAWVVPDILTFIGLGAAVLIFVSYALTVYNKNFLWLATFGFVIHWFGDSLDGTLARYRKVERPRYGYYIDHIVDTVSEAMIFIGLGLSPYIRFDLAMLALMVYFMASIYIYLTTYVQAIFRLSYSGISPTEIRLIAVAANTIIFFLGNPAFQIPSIGFLPVTLSLTLYDLIVIGVIVVILTLFAINVTKTAISLSEEDIAAYQLKKVQARASKLSRKQARREERLRRKAAARRERSGERSAAD